MTVGNQASPEYLGQQFWRDLDPGAEVLALASSDIVSSSSVSGLQTADLQCDPKPHSDNLVSRAVSVYSLSVNCNGSRSIQFDNGSKKVILHIIIRLNETARMGGKRAGEEEGNVLG